MNGKTIHLVQRAVPSLIYQNRNSSNETNQENNASTPADAAASSQPAVNSNAHNVFHQIMGGLNNVNILLIMILFDNYSNYILEKC